MKIRIRFTAILPIIAIPIYLSLLLMFRQQGINGIDENDRMVVTMQILVLGTTAFLGWFLTHLGPINNLISGLNIFAFFSLICLIHYSIIGFLIDIFISWKKNKEHEKDKLEQTWYSEIKSSKYAKSTIKK